MHDASVNYYLAQNLSFIFLSIIVIASACIAVFSPSIIWAAYSLFFTLLGIAGYYVLLGSGFLAITQVIIYVGGILVLLMFGVLLTDRTINNESKSFKMSVLILPCFIFALLLSVFLQIIYQTKWKISQFNLTPTESIRTLGHVLLNDYSLVFEFSALTLLFCLIGAAFLLRRKENK